MLVSLLKFVPASVTRLLLHTYWRFARGMTLGVRAVVLDGEGRVFLVKHSYVPGWHLPGGGVETGETLLEALRRELREEGNIVWTRPPELFGLYFNAGISRRDHVALYVVGHFSQPSPPVPDREIIAHGFFSPDALPEGTSTGTKARVGEVLKGIQISEMW